jgi:hypothetical protein
VSAQRGIAIVQLFVFSRCWPWLLKMLLSDIQNEDQQPLCATAQLRPHYNSEKEHHLARNLHATCIVRIVDISVTQNTSVIIFVFRLMNV